MLIALSTEHKVGLAVVAAAFIVFALASSFLFPRFRPQFPGGGLLAFIVICFVFFFGMLTAVEKFGAEGGEAEGAAQTETGAAQPTTVQRTTTQQQQTTTAPPQQQTTTAPTRTRVAVVKTLNVTETEFKIAMPATLSSGKYSFHVENDGKLPHDLAIKDGPKTKLIQPGASTDLTVTLAVGKYHFFCSVPGHEQAGMKVDVTVS